MFYPDEKGYCKMKGAPKIKAVGLEVNFLDFDFLFCDLILSIY